MTPLPHLSASPASRASLRRGPRRPSLRSVLGPLFLAAVLAPPALAQETRPDQVFVVDQRSGGLVSASGMVTKNELSGVVIEGHGGSTQEFEAGRVRNIVFGTVPASYREGMLLRERGDLLNAAAKFKLAASVEDAREVVRAAARLRAAEALLLHGAVDSSAFTDADTAATRFLQEHAENRETPLARSVQARARLAGGDLKSAAELFRSLFRDGTGAEPKQGYDLELCIDAGLRGAEVYLMAEDTLAAREIYQALEAMLPGRIASLDETDPLRTRLLAAQADARLGEGFALLAGGSVRQARIFFEQQVTDESSPASLRFGVLLGTGLVDLAEGQNRQAEFDLATVSSIDYTDRDRAARALIGLAQAARNLSDPDGDKQAKTWLQSVLDHYPDTIWVRRAQELLQ